MPSLASLQSLVVGGPQFTGRIGMVDVGGCTNDGLSYRPALGYRPALVITDGIAIEGNARAPGTVSSVQVNGVSSIGTPYTN